MAGSRVGLVIYLAFFYLDIYIVIFSRLHDSDVSVAPTTGTGRSSGRGIVQTSLWWQYCAAVCEDRARLRRIVAWAGKRHWTNSPLVLFSLTREIIYVFCL